MSAGKSAKLRPATLTIVSLAAAAVAVTTSLVQAKPLISDSFTLNQTDREAGDGLAGTSVEIGGVTWSAHPNLKFSSDGGITDGVGGTGVRVATVPIGGGGAYGNVVSVKADVNPAGVGSIGVGFINQHKDFRNGTAINLWVTLTHGGTWALRQNGDNTLQSGNIANAPHFHQGELNTVELIVDRNAETVDLLINGVTTLDNFAVTLASDAYLNRAGFQLTQPSGGGQANVPRVDHFSAPGLPEIVFPSDAGIIDVTKPPYNAKGDGVTDDTAAINQALKDYNYGTNGETFMSYTIYLPAGTYLVSDTLAPKDANNPSKTQCSVRIIGAGMDRTTIKLKDNASGFGSPSSAKFVLRTGNRNGGQPNSGFSNYIQHLTVDVGSGNPGAIGIRYDVANTGIMEYVRITSSDPQKSGRYGLGFYGVCGLGTVRNVWIEGFDIGVYLDTASVNNLAFEHLHLSDQGDCGIYNRGKNIAIRGLTSRNDGPAIRTELPLAATVLVEADLEGGGSGPAIEMESPSFLYLRDVTTSQYAKAVTGSPKPDLPSGVVTEWVSHDTDFSLNSASLRLPIKDTPELYSTNLDEWANVQDFGATPDDDTDDDAQAIQDAIDSGKKIVYFPRGHYHIGEDVIVRGGVEKLDLLFSNLGGTGQGNPEVRVDNVDNGRVILANMVVGVPIVHNSPDTVVIANRGGRGVLTTGDNASGDLFVEVCGPHATIEIDEDIHAWLRSINRERMGLLNDGATLWMFADNIERMHTNNTSDYTINPIRTINGGVTEMLGGALDAIHIPHTPQDGALIDVVDSTVSVVYAGELRWNPGQPAPGSWPIHVRTIQNGVETLITEDDVVYLDAPSGEWPKRFVVPLYSTQP